MCPDPTGGGHGSCAFSPTPHPWYIVYHESHHKYSAFLSSVSYSNELRNLRGFMGILKSLASRSEVWVAWVMN